MGNTNIDILNSINYYDLLFEKDIDPTLFMIGTEFIDCNQAALDMLKMSNKKELSHLHPSQISPTYQPDGQLSSKKADNIIAQCYENGFNRFEWIHKNLLKEEFWVEVTIKKVTRDNEDLLYISWRDIRKRKNKEHKIKNKNIELRNKNNYIQKINTILKNADKSNNNLLDTVFLLEEYKKAMDESCIASKTNTAGIITYANEKFCTITGYSREELLGQNHNIIRNPDTPKSYFRDLWETITNKNIFKGVISNRKKDGSIYYVDSTIVPILDNEGNILEYIGIRNDITSTYEKDDIITKQLTYDLTGLHNRQKLLEDLEDFPFPKLALININQFKDINDAYGIKTGDYILKEFSHRLNKIKTFNLKIYRLGGDIFGVLAYGNYRLEDLEKQCNDFIENLKEDALNHDNQALDISLSIGIATGKEWLLPQAEMALMQAKEDSEELVIFDSSKNSTNILDEKIKLTEDIKEALKNDNILLYGQKITNNITHEVKYEVLMRMKNSEGKILSPFFFLEHAKKAKLYGNMTRTIIDKACNYFQDKDIHFSINLTLQDIKNKKTTDHLIEKVLTTKTNNHILLEIVESEGIENFEEVRNFIKKVKSIGCKVAIDDFGTGYSNFEYIIKLDVDILKIDGSLIKNINNDNNMYITVSTIVNFAKALGIETVAEFVHSQEVLDVVKELKIDYSQGFHLHEPEELL